MKKKLLAGIMALALCSTSIPQMIFAEEFTSGTLEEATQEETEETPEVFTDENQAAAGDELGGVSEFSSEEVPEFDDERDNVAVATDDGDTKQININILSLTTSDSHYTNNNGDGVYTINEAGSYYFNSDGTETSNRIVIANDVSGTVKIYLNNVNIKTSAGPALLISEAVTAQVYIYLEGNNVLKTENAFSAALQKDNPANSDNSANLIIDTVSTIKPGRLTANASFGAGIGGGSSLSELGKSAAGISISGGSVTATSTYGAGIGGGYNECSGGTGGSGSYITISGGSVTANSTKGAGIGGGTGYNGGDCSNIIISGGSVTATSIDGSIADKTWVGFSPGSNGRCSDISISGGSIKTTIGCIPVNPLKTNTNVYRCDISNPSSSDISIDEEKWTPSIHSNDDKTLYAWLTGEDHVVTIGNEKKGYIFNSSSSSFSEVTTSENKYNATSGLFTFTPPKSLTYDGMPKNAIIECKSNVRGMGTIHLEYFDSNGIKLNSAPVKAGTYTVKITVEEGILYKETTDYLIDADWKFTINCTHKNTINRYYSSASCTSSGYSGDTYCTDCGALVSYGYTLSAYGHSYDDGVITTEPTTETDGVATYTCKRCKHQKTRTLGKLNDGEPYIDGDFLSKGWDSIKEIIKKSKEKDIVSIILNGAQTLPASVLSELKGKDIDLSLNTENGFIWKINGTSITAETPVDVNLSVTKATDYIPASLYKLISTNQNDFAFHLGTSGAFDFPMVLSVKTDASCAELMANLFWYDAQNQILQCIQSVTVGGALERSIPYADFTLSKGQDYFVAFSTESLNGRSIHADGSITDENGSYLRPADTSIDNCSVDRNKLTVKLAKGCAGAQGYDFVVGKSSNMTQTGKFSKTVSSQSKPQASFKYLAKGTWYVAARSWVLDEQGNKVYGSWSAVKKFKITVVTAQQPKIREVKVKGNTVTITYTKCKNADGYEIVLGTEYKTSTDEKYPVKKYVKRTKNTTTVIFTNVKKGTWYVGVRSWTQPSKAKYKTYSPYSAMKKFKIKK